MNDFEKIFEDNDIVVINKPAGIVVNISETSPINTIQNYLIDYLQVDPNDESEFGKRAGVVHRLDKGTSGVLIIAKNPESFYALKDAFKTREVHKEYIAVVMGTVKDKLAVIKAPIARDPHNRLRMAVVKGGRFALTNLELLGTVEDKYSIILAKPLTGRTHQIRVHLSAMGHPIVSDKIYLGEKNYRRTYEEFGRLMLHAWKIGFKHPKTNKELNFEANLPLEFQPLVNFE